MRRKRTSRKEAPLLLPDMQITWRPPAYARCRWLIHLLIAIIGLLLVSCAPASLQEAPPAPVTSEISFPAEAAISEQPAGTPAPKASPTHIASATPVPDTPTPLPTETPTPQIYVVQAGDSLWGIAEQYQTTMSAIQLANELIDANAIIVGQELVIPSGPGAGEATSSVTTSAVGSQGTPEGRAILPNQVLCPAEVDIEPEGDMVLGYSAVCRIPIVAYQFGLGETPLILVGGIHGGYEWNTILLAYSFLDYLRQNPDVIPPSVTIYLIPNANPDGLYAVTRRIGRFTAADVDENSVPGRFNGNYVDLNRNWDCDWSPNATWRDNPISGGSAPFSEPENHILRDFILAKDPAAAVFLHSAATGVFASGCGQIDPASKTLAQIYSAASGYPLYDGFHYYDITGDAGDWLASQGVPSISIELTDHETLNWDMNRAGLEALITYVAANSDVDSEQTSLEPSTS